MDILGMEFWTALLFIIIIDLALAGDNAVVIGMSARNLPQNQQKKAIIFGTVGAIVIRILATFVVVWLLKIPGLLLIGGILLIWIAFKLLTENKKQDDGMPVARQSLWAAIRTIVIADAVMGIDNVLAVAGAAKGSIMLVILGLIISIPVMVWGSLLILKIIERYPIAIYVGGGILALTAGQMIVGESMIQTLISDNPVMKWGIVFIIFFAVIATAILTNHSKRGKVAGHING